MKFFNFLTTYILLITVQNVSFAVEINTLEKAYQIPSLESAIERLEIKRNECDQNGKNFDRWIDLRFKGNDSVFTGYLSTTFIAGKTQQQQQCQQGQNHQITTNKFKSTLYYIENKLNIENEFRIIADTDITHELLAIIKDGPLLVIDGGSAWNRFSSLPYKSEARNQEINSNYIEINFATDGSEICVKRLWKYIFGGTYETFCVLPLKQN